MLEEIGKEVVDILKKKLVSEDLVVTGNLKNSVHYVVGWDKVEIYAAEYAKFVDSGTKPHSINSEGVRSIRIWASIRGVNPWYVIKKIRKEGTEAHPYLDSLIPQIDTIVKKHSEAYMLFQSEKVYQKIRDVFNKQK